MQRFILLATLLWLCGTAQAAPPQQIEIPTDDKPLQAVLFRPDGAGPFPAVVALHSCDGLRDKSATLLKPVLDWGQILTSAGFVVIFPDSYASRGLSQQCSVYPPKIRPDRERLADARATRDWLQQQDFVRKDRISLIGWHNGGIAALWAVRPNLEPSDDRPDFRSAVVFYPGCRRLGDTAWSTRIPTLILIGALDNWTPAKHCEDMAKNARGRSAQVSIVKYKNAHHAFDHDGVALRQRRHIAFAPDPGGRVTVGTNSEARADAIKRVVHWLSR
ncbi:MAG: dienelactone hydrolase family protein [Pseudomonadota bacterium]